MNKVLTTIQGDDLTYHPQKTFKEVLEIAKRNPLPTDIYLDVMGDDGLEKEHILIGNTREHLTQDDYYVAYDKMGIKQ